MGWSGLCRGQGHWKEQCPLLKNKNGAHSSTSVIMCATGLGHKSVDADVGDKSSFEPFIVDVWVSFIGSSETVNVKVLQDTGARHSFIVQLVLPFSSDTQSGDFIVMHGMELGYIPVPRHVVVLDCDLVRGVFSVAAHPAGF